jgi:two-component system, OmpR family, sensor kinase
MRFNLGRWWSRISLRTKVTGVTVFLLTLGLLVAGIGTMSVLRGYLLDEMDNQLKSAVSELPVRISYDHNDLNPYYIAAVSSGGKLLADSLRSDQSNLRPDVSKLTLLYLTENLDPITLTSKDHTAQWRVIAIPVRATLENGEQATLLVGLSLSSTTAIINRYLAIFLFFGLAVIILGGVLTRLLVTSTFRPLREVEATAARFAAGDFSQRLGGATPNTEVGRLNRSLNSMLSRIDKAFADRAKTIDQMRRFVGDASHELRTPLVSVRGYAELYRMGALAEPSDVAQAMERIEKEAIRMTALVEDLLGLARIDEAHPLQLTAVDLVPLARDAALDAMASAPDRSVTVVTSQPEFTELKSEAESDSHLVSALVTEPETEPVAELVTSPSTPSTGPSRPSTFASATLARLRFLRARQRKPAPTVLVELREPILSSLAIVAADENKIRQVLTNLMGNALRFTPPGSPIEIEVDVDETRTMAILSVIDHGEGVPPQIRERIFQRFWRADNSRNRDTGGSGLGLAIVASIVAVHSGEVDVVETPGGGATFRVLLPLLKLGQRAAENTGSLN